MSDRVSRRSVFAALTAAVLAPLTARLRAAFGRGAGSAAVVAERYGAIPAELSATSYIYDDLCQRVAVPDSNVITTTYIYDSEGSLIAVIEPAPVKSWTYSYEGQGR